MAESEERRSAVMLPAVLFLILYAYPFFERWLTGPRPEQHLCDRPRNQPTRTALGAAAVTAHGGRRLRGGAHPAVPRGGLPHPRARHAAAACGGTEARRWFHRHRLHNALSRWYFGKSGEIAATAWQRSQERGGTAMRDGDEGRGHLWYGPQPDVAGDSGYPDAPPRMGFFTDTSVCIGCKACEVACKEWNAIP